MLELITPEELRNCQFLPVLRGPAPTPKRGLLGVVVRLAERFVDRAHWPVLIRWRDKHWLAFHAYAPGDRVYLVPIRANRLEDENDVWRLEGVL